MRHLWIGLLVLGCGPTVEEFAGPPQPATKPPPVSSVQAAASSVPAKAQPSAEPTTAVAPPPPCPDDMAFVDVAHCPDTKHAKVGLKCVKRSRNEPNNLTICHRFEPGQTCRVAKRQQRFCIDRYEYPNQSGGHPPVMVSAYDAAGLCAEQGKRMCWESEWSAACEGPDLLPFPYGYERSSKHCNIDNRYRHPSLDKVHHRNDAVRGPELLRLDQSVPSGSMQTCKSGFGVYDLTGNFDEWVMTEYRRGKSGWAGLKGGAWGHVRNACRPITTSHVPHWSYYFISFRCCKDADASALAPPLAGVPLWTPPTQPPPSHPSGTPVDRGWAPSQ